MRLRRLWAKTLREDQEARGRHENQHLIHFHTHNQEAIKKDPNHVYYFSLGHSNERLGKLDEAIAAYKQSLEKKPNFTVSLYQLAGVYVRKRELRSAIDPLRKLLAEQPTHELGIFTLGQVYAALGDNDGAMQQYYSLQNLNPRLAANLLQQISK